MIAIAVAFIVWVKMNESKSEADGETEQKSGSAEKK
jgi:hypothetical protein